MVDVVQAAVLVRKSIQWPPRSPEDPSDVLYLKAGSYFADLRVYRARVPPTIDWSMAGTCLTLDGSTAGTYHGRAAILSNVGKAGLRFINVIDSRALLESIPTLSAAASYIDPVIASQDPGAPDQYDVIMTDSNASTTLPTYVETGRMPNPDAPESEQDLDTDFEEVWVAEELPEGSPVLFLESIDGKGKSFFAQIGKHQLDLMDDGSGHYSAYRDMQTSANQWRSIYAISSEREQLPPLLAGAKDWSKGDVVQHGGKQWVVRESGVSGSHGAKWV
jgi:hypothetical protein